MVTDKDINLYIFLREAIKFKHLSGNWEKKDFHGIPFEPWIKKWASDVFTEHKLYQYNNLFEDKAVFAHLYQSLAFRPELKFLFAPEILKYLPEEKGLPEELHSRIEKEASQVSPAAKQEIYPAKTNTPHAPAMAPGATSSEEEKTTMASPGETTPNLPSAPSTQSLGNKLQSTLSSQQQRFKEGPEPKETTPATPKTPRTPFSESKFGQALRDQQERFINGPVSTASKNITSTGSRGFRRGLSGLRGNLSSMGSSLLGGVARGGGKLLTGPVGRGLEKITAPKPSIFSLKGPSRKLLLAVFGMLMGGIIGAGVLSSLIPGQETSTAEAAPVTTSVDYTLPLKNSSVVPVDIRDQIQASFPSAKIEYWDNIIQKTQAAGINPALALTLWIEETGASQTTIVDNGGGGVPNSAGKFSLGHLGCAPLENQTIDESLNCLIKFISNNTFTNDQFPLFMAKYAGGPLVSPFLNNPDFPANFKFWYIKLVPSGDGAAKSINNGAISSCPIIGGKISTPSYNADPANGHCGTSYSYACHCGTTGRRAKAIDVTDANKSSSGVAVRLPQIAGQNVNWTLIPEDKNYPVDDSEGGGVGVTFKATLGTDTWYLDILHLNQTALVAGQNYPSGTQITTSASDHIHMTMGKNISLPVIAGRESDCDTGWLPTDFACQ